MNYWFLIFIITWTYRNNEDDVLFTVPGSKSTKQQGYAVSMCELLKGIIRARAVIWRPEHEEYKFYFLEATGFALTKESPASHSYKFVVLIPSKNNV